MNLLLWIVMGTLALADSVQQDSLNQHLDQAQHFLKRGWLEDAEQEYQAALELPRGPESLELHQLGARIAWRRLDVEEAMLRTQEVAALAIDPEQARSARAAAEAYARDFGFLELRGPHPGIRTRIELQSLSLIIDPELASYGKELASQLREPVMLPTRLALPVGSWSVNGEEVDVQAGTEHDLELPAEAIGHRAWVALQVSRLELSSGLHLWRGDDAAHLLPMAGLKLDWIQPAGPLLLDFSTNLLWTRSASPEGKVSRSGPDAGGGIHIGYEIPNRSALSIRPSAGLRVQQISALLLECRGTELCWICTRPGLLSEPENLIHAGGLLLLTGAALGIDYRSDGGRTALGTGIRISLENGRGRAAENGIAELKGSQGSGTPVEWTSEDADFQGWQLGVQASVSLAF